MPDVGSLNIEITSNAAEAAAGLGALATKLGSVKKNADGFDLTKVQTNITNIVNAVKGSEKTMASLGTLFNATATYFKTFGKITSAVKINVEPIKQLKEAIGDGIKIGIAGSQINQLRTALEGEWKTDNAYNAGFALSAIAEGAKAAESADISKVANDIRDLATSINVYTDATDRSKNAIGTTSSTINEVKKEAEATEGTMTRLQQLMGKRANIQLFGGTDSASRDWRSALMGQGDFVAGVETETAKLKEIVTQIQVTDAVMQKVADNVSTVGDRFSSAISEETVIAPIRMISESFREAEKYIRYYESGIDAILPKINQLSSEHMIEAGNAKLAAMSEKELRVAILDAQGELPTARTMSPVQLEQVQNVQQFNIELQETGDIIQSVIIPRFTEMYQIWSMFAYEFGAFQMQAARLTAGSTPLFLGDGRTPGQLLLGDGSEPETFLSTWVRVGEEFKTNWVMFTSDVAEQWRAQWSPDWILGGWQTPMSMSTFHLGQGESPLLLGDGGVSPDEMLSTFVDTSEQWKQNWVVGEEYVEDVVEETESITDKTNRAAKSAEEYEAVFARILAEKAEEARIAEQIRNSQEAIFYGENKKSFSIDQTNSMADNLTQLDLLNAQLREAEVQYNKFVNELGAGDAKTIKAGLAVSALRDKIWEYNHALEEAREGQEETGNSAISLSGAWGAFKNGIEKLFPTISSLLKRFKQIVKYRMLRSVLKHITSGFTEGVKNVYQYSKAIGSDLASAMDRGATALQQMKNSIGAAVAPVIQALIPVLQNVVNWFINLINYVNQFFALMNGQNTWTRALPEQADAFEKSTKSAKGASKAMKDLLADWDELNIIQSQSGNGSGTGTGKTAEEYKNMFEEVNEFDERVKDTLRFIEEHLGGLPEILKKAGAVLLGWKFSKAFSGFLGSLGKLIAGGALIAIGVDFSYGAAFDAGSKGYFDSSDIIRSIAGAVATAIGGSLITTAIGIGPASGFVIGLTLAALITLVGYIDGEKDMLDRRKWGTLKKTREEIEEFVRSQFTFDVDATINVLEGVIANEETAREDLNKKIDTFTKSLDEAKVMASISVDSDETGDAVTQAAADAREAIKSVENLLEAHNDGITVMMKTFKFTDAEGNDISDDLLSSISIADQSIKTYFTDIGSQLAHWVTEGETKGWNDDITRSALALMEREQKILQKAQEYKDQLEFNTKLDYSMSQVVDRDTAETQLEIQKKLLSDYEDTARNALQTQFDTASYLASLATASAEDALEQANAAKESGNIELFDYYMEQYNGLIEAAETYQTEAKTALNKLNNIDEELVATKEEMARSWAETLQKVYGKDFSKEIDTLINKDTSLYPISLEDIGNDPFGNGYLLGPGSKTHSYDETAELLKNRLISALENSDMSGATANYFEKLGGSLWDFLEDGARKQVASNLLSVTDSAGDAYQIFKRMFGLDEETAKKYIDPMYQDIWSDVTEDPLDIDVSIKPKIDNLEDVKKAIEEAMQDGVMSTEESMDIMVKFGWSNYEDAMRELQYNLDEEGYNRGSIRPVGLVASTGVSDTGWTPYVAPTTTGGMEGTDISGDVAKGTAQGNGEQNDLIQQLINIATRIANKDFKVVVSPSSSWGNFNNRSGSALEKVTGFMNGF